MVHLERLIAYKKNMLLPIVEKIMDGSVIKSEELLSEQSKNGAEAIDVALEEIANEKGIIIVRNIKKHSLSLGTKLHRFQYIFRSIFKSSTPYLFCLSIFLFTISGILSILKNAKENYEVFENLNLLDDVDVIFSKFIIVTEIVTLFVILSIFLTIPTKKVYGRKGLFKK